MNVIRLRSQIDFSAWRDAARRLLAARVAPEDVQWLVGAEGTLFDDGSGPTLPDAAQTAARVPAAFTRLCRMVILHRDPQRFALLYRMLWRLRDEPRLLEVASDIEVARARLMEKAIDRDVHKMHAYVRFRESVLSQGAPVYVAWFEPMHYIVEAAAPFFVRRFASTRWSILTPDASAYWDGNALQIGPALDRSATPGSDALETLWRTYYSSIFNPARLRVEALQGHMPKKYWRNLPEAALIPALVTEAAPRMHAMFEAEAREPRRRIRTPAAIPLAHVAADTVEALRAAAASCRECPLWEHATQTVFGEGRDDARVVLVGEQPGDQEDLAGTPFVGPAGALLDRALAASGIAREALYLTNAVKHFKFESRGRRRLHRTPGQLEIEACRNWLDREFERIRPKLVVALGATALRALTGRSARIEDVRGRVMPWREGTDLLVTTHPAAVLRADAALQESEYKRLVADLALVASFVASARAA